MCRILAEHSQSSLSGGGVLSVISDPANHDWARLVCLFPEASGLVSEITDFRYSIKIYFVNLSHPIILQGFHTSKILQSPPVLTKSSKFLQNAQEIAFFGKRPHIPLMNHSIKHFVLGSRSVKYSDHSPALSCISVLLFVDFKVFLFGF